MSLTVSFCQDRRSIRTDAKRIFFALLFLIFPSFVFAGGQGAETELLERWKSFLSAYGMPDVYNSGYSAEIQKESSEEFLTEKTSIEEFLTEKTEKPPYFCQKELSDLCVALVKFQKSEIYAMERNSPDSMLVQSIDRSLENAKRALDLCEKSDREAYRIECGKLFSNMDKFLLFTIESDRKYFMPFLNLLTSISFVCIATVLIGIAYVKQKEEAGILAEKNEAERLLTKTIAHVQESERGRISRDLHDTVMQDTRTSLLYLRELESLSLREPQNSTAKKNELLKKIKEIEEQNMKNIRAIIRNLTPPEIENAKFETLLADFAQTAESAYNIPCKFYAEPGSPFYILSSEQKLHIFRIIQESVTNAAKHSGAGEISIIARHEDSNFIFLVSDDGHGFTPETETNSKNIRSIFTKKSTNGCQIPTGTHLGLRGMKSRADILHAELTIKSNPDSGTQVRLKMGGGSE